MCLRVINSKEPLIATEDITVYKRLQRVGKSEYQSPYRGYSYKRGQMYTSRLDKVKSNKRHHPKTYKDHNMNRMVTAVGVVDRGIHAYVSRVTAKTRSKDEAWGYDDESIITCVIPKGARYYLGDGNEIASDKLFIGTKIKE